MKTIITLVVVALAMTISGCALKRPVTATGNKLEGINIHVPKSCVIEVLRTGCDISVTPAKCKHTYVTYNADPGCQIVELKEAK